MRMRIDDVRAPQPCARLQLEVDVTVDAHWCIVCPCALAAYRRPKIDPSAWHQCLLVFFSLLSICGHWPWTEIQCLSNYNALSTKHSLRTCGMSQLMIQRRLIRRLVKNHMRLQIAQESEILWLGFRHLRIRGLWIIYDQCSKVVLWVMYVYWVRKIYNFYLWLDLKKVIIHKVGWGVANK